MLKLGVIGLGGIAQKAYLPVLSSREVELHLFTRDADKLEKIGRQYRINHLYQDIQSFIDSGIKGAFVHTATSAHEAIIEQLLLSNIHVYVDKPITYNYSSAERLTQLAESKGLILMTGFNRRYAPSYQKLKELKDVNMIVMQKNRQFLPGDVRTFVYDDFIHVLDTILYLFPYPVKDIVINGKQEGGLLYHAIVQLIASNGASAIGIMNRDSGTVEEKLEVFTPNGKNVVYDVSDTVVYSSKNAEKLGTDDWNSTLFKRGFDGAVDDFIKAVGNGGVPQISARESLSTHEICERVVTELSHR